MRANQLVKEIAEVLNRHNAEIGSDTPDFILASFMVSCLMSFDAGLKARSDWYGRHDQPGKNDVDSQLNRVARAAQHATKGADVMKDLITLEIVRDNLQACYDSARLERLYDRPHSALEVLTRTDGEWSTVPAKDRLWTVLRSRFVCEKTLRLFACECAERALSLIPGRMQHEESRNAIAVARRFANGVATSNELAAACAARAAADAAAYAAADAAARAAAYAAYAAAYAAADAAAYAAYAAARAAAEDDQVVMLVKLMSQN